VIAARPGAIENSHIKQSIKDSRYDAQITRDAGFDEIQNQGGVGDFRLCRHLKKNGDCFGMMIAY
jgi:hypothetical protein